ncbi:neuropeptide Y receptor [Clonorchis sinensis]|uniref:Neuropeptide Y receptor n=1 Tax=Clonorchis sinensis TaxID=79923 RepID=G7YM09_CLOSI|nr:neuropeptide Y receptor [Clonorchis sinensis]
MSPNEPHTGDYQRVSNQADASARSLNTMLTAACPAAATSESPEVRSRNLEESDGAISSVTVLASCINISNRQHASMQRESSLRARPTCCPACFSVQKLEGTKYTCLPRLKTDFEVFRVVTELGRIEAAAKCDARRAKRSVLELGPAAKLFEFGRGREGALGAMDVKKMYEEGISIVMNFKPPDLPLSAKFVISILVSILVAIAIFGNIAVIILLTTHRLCWKNRSSTYNGRKPQITGHSATCTFLLNLSVADLLHVVLCAPFTLVSDFLLIYWPFGEALCRIVNYAQGLVVSLCAFTHVVLSLDRLTAIKCPIWRRRKLSSFGARIIVLGIWLCAMTIPLPCLFVCHVVIGPMGKTYCQEIWPRTPENYSNFTASDRLNILSINGTPPYERLPDYLSSPLEVAYGLTLLLFQYAIPLTVITGTYLAIVYRIWGKRPPGECDVQRDEKRSTAKKRETFKKIQNIVGYWLRLIENKHQPDGCLECMQLINAEITSIAAPIYEHTIGPE